MPKFIKKRSAKIGLPPGSLVQVGDRLMERTKITVIDYDADRFIEKEVESIEECFPFKEKPTVTWFNLDGVHNKEMLEKLGYRFDVHPLVLEDIMNTDQRPKMEDFGGYIFVVLKMLCTDGDGDIVTEQVSLILGSNFVFSFQEREGDVFDPVRDRIRNSKGRIRKMAADYLVYSLIDSIVDNYFLVLERLGEKVELLDEELVANASIEALHSIRSLKRIMIFMRKSLWPLREAINALLRGESQLIEQTTGIYLKDVYDHTIQVIDTVETFRDVLSGMLDIYLSSISNKMNEVMKVLTIIATIFIPLTFVAGIYGMNFKLMPELEFNWGYPVVLCVMAVIAAWMVVYFKRKKWL